MPTVTENRLEAAEADSDSLSVRLFWRDGSQTIAEFSRLAGSGVFESFRDPEFFKKVVVKLDGRALAWPGGIDFCADALWFEAHPGDVPDNLKPFQPAPRTPVSPTYSLSSAERPFEL